MSYFKAKMQRVGRRRGGEVVERREGKRGQERGGKGMERTILHTPCHKFLATPLETRGGYGVTTEIVPLRLVAARFFEAICTVKY